MGLGSGKPIPDSGSRSATLIASMRITKQVPTFYYCGGPINFSTDPGYYIRIQLKSMEISRQNCIPYKLSKSIPVPMYLSENFWTVYRHRNCTYNAFKFYSCCQIWRYDTYHRQTRLQIGIPSRVAKPVLRIRFHMFLILPDPLVKGTDPDPSLSSYLV
jgi:hypothetical protein